jgi:hypothetical protein
MRRIESFALIGIVLLAFSDICLAAEPEAEAEAFISKLKIGKSVEAVDALYASNPWISKSSDAIVNIKNQLGSLNKLVGSLKSHEKLQDLSVGTRFRYMSYLAAYERQPIRFIFEFYKPDATWLIFSFSLDDKLDDDLEKSAKEAIGKK